MIFFSNTKMTNNNYQKHKKKTARKHKKYQNLFEEEKDKRQKNLRIILHIKYESFWWTKNEVGWVKTKLLYNLQLVTFGLLCRLFKDPRTTMFISWIHFWDVENSEIFMSLEIYWEFYTDFFISWNIPWNIRKLWNFLWD